MAGVCDPMSRGVAAGVIYHGDGANDGGAPAPRLAGTRER